MKAIEHIFSQLSAELLKMEKASIDDVEIHNSNELILYVDGDDNEMVGVEFQLFNEDMLVTEDGSIFIIEDDAQLLVEDDTMLKAIASFLSWRTKILKDLSM